ncbi:MAG: DUF1553 domain-containing protein [Verrucomicrobiales bacterium]|nr:DUF1553 domain-containing protein [Verrucomicrobiales bacterium]
MTGRHAHARRGLLTLIASLLFSGFSLNSAMAAPGQSFEAAKNHWAYQPVRRPVVPRVKAESRVQTPIDAFLLADLEAKGLTFAPPASPQVLLRRVYYDLTGLPPTYEQIQRFEADPSPEAYARVVDELLASPRYGERWGRHWLDIARYADTKDLVLLYGRDALRPFAYTYRDYVIRAFNEDLPFAEFIADQMAADLVGGNLPPWRLAGLGFLTLGRLFDNNPHDQIDDQIDTVSRGLLGVTVACARCHDHKYDAVTMEDYYGLYGVFASTERPYVLPLIEDPAQVVGGPEFESSLAKARRELEDHIDAEFKKLTEIMRWRIGDYLVRAVTTAPDLTETTQFALSLTPEDFRPSLMRRTRRFLETRVTPEDPVFGPWSALFALPEAELPDAAGRALAGLGLHGKYNHMILDALSSAALSNRADIARVYGRVLTNAYVATRLGTNAVELRSGIDPQVQALADIVAGPDSPVGFPRRETPDHMSRPDKDRYGGLVLNLDKIAAHASNAPPARAMVVTELPQPVDPKIFVRGNPSRPGVPVPRSSLRLLHGGEAMPLGAGSGRLELARDIASTSNPLTPRVMVNRVWMHHFGEPLVASPADFGVRSERPTHPDLLDWLASEFLEGGGRWKRLHRQIVLSAAYQQQGAMAREVSNELAATAARVDPDNRLLWHYPRRRLDFEAMRDTQLYVAGRLDEAMGGRPVDVAGDAGNRRRTVYGLVDRQNLPGVFRSFDFAAPDQCSERRPRTMVPQQALFAMNSAFVMEQAAAVALRPEIARHSEHEQGIDALFRRVLSRPATEHEKTRAHAFLVGASDALEPGFGPWAQLAQVLLVSNEAMFID